LSARAVLIRQIEWQGWRATSRPSVYGGFVDIVMTRPPDADDPPRFVEVQNDRRRSIRYGEWVERDDGVWVLRIGR
jgi:hypothetical protein